MKSIRIANSVKLIDATDHNVTLFRIQEILAEHRSALIMNILSDLPTYLRFKCYGKIDKEKESRVKDKLLDLANSRVDLDRYYSIVQEIQSNDVYRVPTPDFLREIDIVLDSQLNPSQLKLIS